MTRAAQPAGSAPGSLLEFARFPSPELRACVPPQCPRLSPQPPASVAPLRGAWLPGRGAATRHPPLLASCKPAAAPSPWAAATGELLTCRSGGPSWTRGGQGAEWRGAVGRVGRGRRRKAAGGGVCYCASTGPSGGHSPVGPTPTAPHLRSHSPAHLGAWRRRAIASSPVGFARGRGIKQELSI